MKRKDCSEYRCLGFEVNGEMCPLGQLPPEIVRMLAGAFIHILDKMKQAGEGKS